jgi:uncharacterized membrane protein
MRQFVAWPHHVEGAASPEECAGKTVCAGDGVEATILLSDAEPVLGDWLMKRNCSVSPRQFVWFYISLALFSSAIALSLVMRGAWPVLPFTGIEVLVVGIAFVIHARHAVDYERIRLFPNRLVIEQMCAERLTRFEFNPRWVRIEQGRRSVMRSSSCRADRRWHSGSILRIIGALSLRKSYVRCSCGADERGNAIARGRGFEWKSWVRKL